MGRYRTKHECLPPTQPYPWLLYFHGDINSKQQTFCSISDPNKTYSKSIPELSDWDTSLLTVQYGWCLLEKAVIQLGVRKPFLWNPSNLDKIDLPHFKFYGEIRDCIFSCSPTATDQVCSIFLFTSTVDVQNVLFYHQLGDTQWTQVDYTEDLVRASALENLVVEPIKAYLYKPVYCNGHLYAVSIGGVRLLVVIEKLEPQGLEINSTHVFMPKASPHDALDWKDWLLESNNQLFHVQVSQDMHSNIAIVVCQLDFSQMVWVRVKSIQDKVFFLSHFHLPFVCQAINPAEGGLIYFTSCNNNYVHIYNVQDNSLVIVRPFSNLPQEHHHPLWFRSDQRMTFSLQKERGKTQTKGGKVVRQSIQMRQILSSEIGDRVYESVEIIDALAKYLMKNRKFDYLHFRATCDLFRSRAPPLKRSDPSYTSMSSFDDLSASLLLVFFEKGKVLTVVHPKHGTKYKYSISLPKVIQGDCQICYSKDGWLLLTVNKLSNMFFNPFTKEVKQLANGPREVRNIQGVGFSHPPTSSECVVVELFDAYSIKVVHTTRLGKGTWDKFEFEDSELRLSSVSPCFHNGVFYYLSSKGKLRTLQVGEDTSWEELEKPDAPCFDYYKCFLVECNGSLLSIFEGHFGNWVQVFKLNESKTEWTRVESLENHMLFVGNQSFSALANIPGMDNKIYFPRFYDQNIVFYSLETKNYHTFKSSEVVSFHCMKEVLGSSWNQPRWH